MNFNFNVRLNELLKQPRKLNMSKLNKIYERLKFFTDMDKEEFKKYVDDRIKQKDPFVLEALNINPSRQNIYENLQLQILSEYFGYSIKQHLNLSFENTKTFDGINEEHKTIFNCKYINESCGNQDNQFNDLLKFNQTYKDYTNYLVISGKYGISKIRKSNIILEKNVNIIILDDKIEIISQIPNTKHYSTKKCLVDGFKVSDDVNIIEPFAGNMDLLKLLNTTTDEMFDIEPKDEKIVLRDTLTSPPDYNNKFVITNPPYKAKNHLTDKEKQIYNLPIGITDLYLLFISHLIDSHVIGGILILPINFILGKETQKIREQFLEKYKITRLNLYQFKCFEYTTQTVCSFQFENSKQPSKLPEAYLYDSETHFIKINLDNPFTNITKSKKYMRGYNVKEGFKSLGVVIKLLDPNITAEKCDLSETDIKTDRCKFTVYTTDNITQEEFIKRFNSKLSEIRTNYPYSLSTYRDTRCRLSFDEVLKIINIM